MDNSTKKTRLIKRFEALKAEYTSYEAAYKDLSRYINPKRGYFSDTQRGQMIDHKTLLDDHASHANRVLASGMQSGMTSPSRPWFRLNTSDKGMNKIPSVRMWLDDTAQRMLEVCSNTNVYDVFYSIYEELGQFGTGCAIILEDYDKVIRLRNFTAGEYWIGVDHRGIVNRFGREFKLKTSQCVEFFGLENCSDQVKSFYQNDQIQNEVTIRHLIEPNDEADLSMDDNKNMAFRSVYWEVSGGNTDKFLSTTGFMEFPIIAPRWDVTTSCDALGYGPGWFALGNIKQLQKTCLDEMIAKEKLHNPPMLEDSNNNGISNYMPGGKTKVNNLTNNGGARPAYQINPQLQSFLESKRELKEAIDKTFFVNVFLMMINFDKTNMTATEVAQREQENIMMMGPLLTRVNQDMLTPFLDRLYAIMERNFMLLPPPPEIEGMEIKVEFISILAQAQKAIGAVAIDRVLARLGSSVGIYPDSADVLNGDEIIREFAEMEGIPAKVVNSEKVVQQIRENRAQAQQIAQNLAAVQQASDTAKNLSQAKMDDDNVLTRMAGAQQ